MGELWLLKPQITDHQNKNLYENKHLQGVIAGI